MGTFLDIYDPVTACTCRWIRSTDRAVYKPATKTFETSLAFADGLITLTKNTTTNSFPVTLPDDVGPGLYDVLFYDDAAPTNVTPILVAYMVKVDKDGVIRRFMEGSWL